MTLDFQPTAPQGARFRVLLVEDNPGDADLASTFLSETIERTFEISHVHSLAQATARLSAGPVDAVLIDLSLPDSQGMETLTRLKSVTGRAAVIVLSGAVTGQMRDAAMKLGADDVLSKADALTQMLGQCVSDVITRSQSFARHRTLEGMLEAIPDAIIVTTGAGDVLYVNQAAVTLFRRDRDAFLRDRFDVPLKPGEPREIVVRRPDGIRVGEIRIASIEWNGVPAFLGSIRDQTELLASREALRASDSLKAAILSSTKSLVIATDINGTVTAFNRAAEEALGYLAEEVVHKQTPALWHDANEVANRAMALSAELGRPIQPGFEVFTAKPDLTGIDSNEWTFTSKHGVRFPVSLVVTCVRDETGEIIGYLGTIEDITERKQSENALKLANKRFAIAADAAGIGFWHWDLTANTLTWDDWMFRLYGRARSDGHHPFNLWLSSLHADDKGRIEREIFDAVAGKHSFDTECRVVHPDGQIRHLKGVASVVREADGTATQVSGVVFDITDRKQSEFRLNHLVGELERRNRELESFAHVASHDLKAPLRGVHLLAGWIAQDLQEAVGESTREHLRLMQNRIDRMGRLLEDLLAYARAGRVDGDIVAVDTGALVRDVFDLLATPKAIRLVVSAQMPVMRTRKVPLELVFRNLINNAIKHHDKPEGCITISARPIVGGQEFCVTDDGPGIPLEHQKRVFGMLQTLKPRDEVEGSGIGLALVMKTVELVKGSVTLESDGTHGCTFRFTWPDDILAIEQERARAAEPHRPVPP